MLKRWLINFLTDLGIPGKPREKPIGKNVCDECRWPTSCSMFTQELKRCEMLDWPEVKNRK
jgi:hypothetical protein